MQTLRWLFIALLILITTTGIIQAQETAYELPAIQNGETIQGSFEENIISQLYGFYASANDIVRISMIQENDELDPFLVLMDSEGAVLAYDDDSGSTALSALIDGYTVEADGFYFVLATSELLGYLDGTENETSDTLDYTLSISGQSTPATVEDPELIQLETSPLSLGTAVNGESLEETPAVFFSFEGEAGSTVSLRVDADNFYSVLYLFAPDGSRIAVDPSVVSIDLEEDGVYLVMVADWRFHEAIDGNGAFEGGEFSLQLGN